MRFHTKALRRKPAGKERAKARHRPPRSGKRKSTTALADGVKTWTIRCVANLPSVNTLEVEAETLEEACTKAITTSNDDPHWEIAGQSGRTFIDGYCEGVLDAGRGSSTRLKSDVPYAFCEDGLRQRPTIKTEEAIAATKLHEILHWSGSPGRLNREFGKRFGDAAYAFEELTAEIGACMLMAELSITPDVRPDHAQYLSHWLSILKQDKRAIFTAAARAQDAVTFLKSFQPARAEAQDSGEALPLAA